MCPALDNKLYSRSKADIKHSDNFCSKMKRMDLASEIIENIGLEQNTWRLAFGGFVCKA